MTHFHLSFCLTLCLSVYNIGQTLAQTAVTPLRSLGSWLIGTVQLPGGDKKWGGFAEVQARSDGAFSQFFYSELKGGVGYDLDRNFTLSLAGGRYATHDYRDLSAGPLNTEKRLWEQLVINQFLARIRFEHRYRVEQRWINFRDGTDTFRSRIRYRLNMFVPINNRTLTDKTVFLSVNNEIFLNPVGPAFERNRAYAGLGYQVNQHIVLQIGLVNQTNYNVAAFDQGVFTPQSASSKNNIVLNLTYRIKRRIESEKLPSQPD